MPAPAELMPELFPAWFTAWASSVTLIELLIYALAIAAVLKWGKRWWRGVVAVATGILAVAKTLDSIQGLTAFMAATTATLADQTKTMATQDHQLVGIYHETHKNDGSSIKDAGLRTEEAVDRLERGMLAVFVLLDAAGIRAAADEDSIRQELEDTHPKEKRSHDHH
ncbi:hypothetical protein [Cryobacterium sp. Y11]|uniref:hypothetical protein n=1 Tax=Cryobacterium sp. Y11 TaxID=2045016 RepID=UPI000CE3055B|nr:hypothetical protein [Cryobacterium sp. Y11]